MTDMSVISEPLTYERHAERSYFRDLALRADGNHAAAERLDRHAAEMDVERRANPSSSSSFAIPLWLIDEFATAPRPHRVLAAAVPNFRLPVGGHSVNLPRFTTGNRTRPVPDLAADPSQDAVDAQASSTVATITGHADVALQLLEQSPAGAHLDSVFFKDLTESYDSQVEAQLINGTGTNGQLTGLLNLTLPTANTVTYDDASPSATEMFASLGKMVAAVGNSRKLPPEMWLMTTSRLAWLGSGEDLQNRPLMLTDRDGSGNLDILAYQAQADDAIPSNLAATGNQDRIIVTRPSDHLLLESDPHTSVQLEPLSGALQARLQLHGYVAFIGGRYPSSTAVLQGTGTVVQSGF